MVNSSLLSPQDAEKATDALQKFVFTLQDEVQDEFISKLARVTEM